jgi:hypothetical protein
MEKITSVRVAIETLPSPKSLSPDLGIVRTNLGQNGLSSRENEGHGVTEGGIDV